MDRTQLKAHVKPTHRRRKRISCTIALGLFVATLATTGCGSDEEEFAAEQSAPVQVQPLPQTTGALLSDAMATQKQATEQIEGLVREISGPPIKTVGELINRRTCSTELTRKLNIQLAAQMNCIRPGFFEPISDIQNLDLGPAANPFLQAPAAKALIDIAATNPEAPFTINSSWRSVAQQHVLKSWKGGCGIRVVADPGTSHHESGLAIDVHDDTTMAFRESLKRKGWVWYCDRTNNGRMRGCRDRPHHTFKREGSDLRTLNVLAFQKLWNRAHPDDLLKESGRYNITTAKRLNRTPLTGFPTGPTCDSEAFIAQVTQTREERAVAMAIKAHTHVDDSLAYAHRLASNHRPVPVPVATTSSWSPASLFGQLFEL